jgi:hypothetical protein
MLSYREVGRLNLLRMHLQSLASQHRCHPLPLTPPPARERSGDMSPGAVGGEDLSMTKIRVNPACAV